MLRAAAFPAPSNSVSLLTRSVTAHHDTCHSLASACVIHAHSSLLSRFEFQQFQQPRVNLRAAHGGGVVAAAVKKQRLVDAGLAAMDDDFYDDDDDDDEYHDDDDDAEDDDGDGEELLPLEKMRRLFKKKPKGFGEGKVYDTSVEDKLLEEMRQSRKAQAANLKKLKNDPVKPGSNKSDQKKKDAEVVPIGGRVCLVNLPKKKNIHRDLKSALQGIPGIMNIVPAVSRNKKTRDPICKGFAFVDFKRGDDAVRFVELYSGQTITFGKIQKQIKCELLNAQSSPSASPELSKNVNAAPHVMASSFVEESNEDSIMENSVLSSWDGTTSDDSDDLDDQIYEEEEEEEASSPSASPELSKNLNAAPRLMASSFVEESNEDSIMENSALKSWDGTTSDDSDDLDDQIYEEEDEEEEEEEEVGENPESATALKVDYDDSVEVSFDTEISSLSSEPVNKNPTAEKSSAKVEKENARKKSKEKAKKVAKLDIPGSAKRLKIREKAILSDVFNKYRLKAGVASKDS